MYGLPSNPIVQNIKEKINNMVAENVTLLEANATALADNEKLRNEVRGLKAKQSKGSNNEGGTNPIKSESASPRVARIRASSVLPAGSAVRRAISGDNPENDSSSSSDDDRKKPGGGGDDKRPTPPKKGNKPGKKPRKRRSSSPDSESPDDSSPDSNGPGDIFDEEPESEHSSDSDSTKSCKRQARRPLLC